ncbi:hypothetical protein ACFQDD_00390 [Halorubrum pallidum]|uniref:Uncharacterized protein n=1 Tax=Halorubrum pallidum TaxID=1526114 RepID=A0ABD5SZQ8_9EURY
MAPYDPPYTAPDRETFSLPAPETDPILKYAHEGKEYRIGTSDTRAKVTTYLPDELSECEGVVVLEVDSNATSVHEHTRPDAGVTAEVLEPYVEEYGDEGTVVTGALLRKDVEQRRLVEVDSRSYMDLYYNAPTAAAERYQ